MDKTKLLLMIGGTLILVGIILRIVGVVGMWPVLFFATGGLLKAVYLGLGVMSGRFVLGVEIILLPIGVALVLVGVFLKNNPYMIHLYGWFIASGVLLKSSFLFLFFRRQRKKA